jgi:predicted methyltransferase
MIRFTTSSRAVSALVALALASAVSACGPSSQYQPAASTAAAPALRLGVTNRMPSSEGETLEAPVVSSQALGVVTAPDRAASDRRFDGERRPAELLTFLGVEPGSRVAVLVAGVGYTAELLARAVALGGTVYAENPEFVLASAEKAWNARLATPAMKTAVRVDRELSDPLPPEARDLDLVVINLVYHDAVSLGVDRERMNRAVLAALRSGGKYVVIDHSARPGAGVIDARTLHRIDQDVVRAEVESVGFRLVKEGNFLRNPSDTRNWSDSPAATRERGDTSDRFALMFVKP